MGKKDAKPKHTAYYEELGVEPSATAEELKKAYRKCSLRLHPDRGGDAESFARMKNMYDVLSDPSKRKMYDRYGPDVVKMMDGDMSGSPMAFVTSLRKRDRALLVAVFTALSLIVLAFPILLSLRWDAEEDDEEPYSWAVAFIPLWLLEALLFAGVMEQFRQAPLDRSDPDNDAEAVAAWEKMQRDLVIVRAVFCVMLGLQVLLQVFLAIRLDEAVSWSWYLVLLPWMLFHLAGLVSRLAASPDRFRAEHRDGDAAGEFVDQAERRAAFPLSALLGKCSFWAFALNSVKWSAALLATAVATAAVAEANEDAAEDDESSFYLAAIPLFVVIGFALIKSFASVIAKRKDKANKQQDADAGADAEAQAQAQAAASANANANAEADPDAAPEPGLLGTFLQWLCSFGFLLLMICLAASKLTDVSSFSAFAIFSPLFIVVGCFCICFSLSALTVGAEDLAEAEAGLQREHMNQQSDDDDSATATATATNNNAGAAAPDGQAGAADYGTLRDAEAGAGAGADQVKLNLT